MSKDLATAICSASLAQISRAWAGPMATSAVPVVPERWLQGNMGAYLSIALYIAKYLSTCGSAPQQAAAHSAQRRLVAS